MHSELLSRVNETQLKEFVSDILAMLKMTNENLYDSLEWHLYCEMYGCHFSDFLLEKVLSEMKNSDDSYGGHWTLEQTTQVAKQLNIQFNEFNNFDWCYVMNMKYSDYATALGQTDAVVYAKLAKAFLEDKDGPNGKALKYYIAMKNKKSPGDF